MIPAECVCGNPAALPKSVERGCAKLPRPRAGASGVPPTFCIRCLEPVYKQRVHVVEQEYLQLSRTSRTSRCRLSIHKRNTSSTRCAFLGTPQRPLSATSGTPPFGRGCESFGTDHLHSSRSVDQRSMSGGDCALRWCSRLDTHFGHTFLQRAPLGDCGGQSSNLTATRWQMSLKQRSSSTLETV